MPATPEQLASAKRWLIALFVYKGIEVLSVAVCIISSWRFPQTITSGVAVVWVLGTIVIGWFFDALCFEKLARIKGDHDMPHRFDLLRKLGIAAVFVGFYYVLIFK